MKYYEEDEDAEDEIGNEAEEQENNDAGNDGGNLPQRNSASNNIADTAKKAQKIAQKAGKSAATKGKFAAALGPIIFWALVIIVIFIVIVGIIMFFITMPGMVMEKLKEIGKAIAKALSSWFGGDDTQYVEDKQIYETLGYLEEMGYDLKGYGFLTDYMTNSDVDDLEEIEKQNGAKLDPEVGVIRDDDGNIIKAASDFVMAYQISDNYTYTVKNENLVTDGGFWGGIQAIGRHFIDFFGGSLGENWTRGLIAIYKEGSAGLGSIGAFYSDKGFLNFEDLKIDVENKTLEFKNSKLFNSNHPMTYSLDGWTGRYGMPIDFLVSVHLATMMPDLSYDMANSFETEINLILREITEAEVTSAYKTNNGVYITYDDFELRASEGFLGGIHGWRIGNEEGMKILKELGIKSPDDCYGPNNEELNEKLKDVVIDGYGHISTINNYDKEYYPTLHLEEKAMAVNVYNGIYRLIKDEYGYTNENFQSIKSLDDYSSDELADENIQAEIESATEEFKNLANERVVYDDASDLSASIDMRFEDIILTSSQTINAYANIFVGNYSYRWLGNSSTYGEKYYNLDICVLYMYNMGPDPNNYENTIVGDECMAIYYVVKEEKTDEEIEELLNEFGITNPDEIVKCSESGESAKKCCEICRAYLQAIYDELKSPDDSNYAFYIPYIHSVIDHWYRDVYFVNKSINPVKYVSFVQSDYDYEAIMKERWTLYETYTNNSADGYKYNPDKVGEYILYELDENGEYKKNGHEYVIFDGTEEDAKPSILYQKQADGTYITYTGNDRTIEGLYRKNSNEEYVPYTGDVVVSKKAASWYSYDTEALEDLGWSQSGDVWSAYEDDKEMNTDWEKAYEEADLEDDSDLEKSIKNQIYTKIKASNTIEQTGEGQRAETNPEIKRMFLSNTYFRYDGNVDTAEKITNLRQKIALDLGKKEDETTTAIEYGALNELVNSQGEVVDYTNKMLTDDGLLIDAPGVEDEEVKGTKVSEYSGQVTLNQDALNAFSMLENTHTLDSDYIYRDFKELIVELGYFTKEELTDETPKLLQWIVPDTGSDGYPDRTIDKRENEPGTMVHSKGDIDANVYNTLSYKLQEQALKEKEEEPEIEPDDVDDIEPEISSSLDDEKLKSYTAGGVQYTVEDLEKVLGDFSIESNNKEIETLKELYGSGFAEADEILERLKSKERTDGKKDSSVTSVTVNQFLGVARDMCEQMDELGYDYCVYRRHQPKNADGSYPPSPSRASYIGQDAQLTVCDKESCNCETGCGDRNSCSPPCPCCASPTCDHVFEHGCHLADTFEASKEKEDYRNVCCNQLVYWVMKDVGITFPDGHGVEGIAVRALELGGQIIEEYEDLKPGDIMFYLWEESYRLSHVDILGEEISDGVNERFTGGHYASVGHEEQIGDYSSIDEFDKDFFDTGKLCFGIRLFGESEPGIYKGYNGNEAVVSPVTGVLLDYGTYDNTGIDVKAMEKEAKRVNVDLKYGPLLKEETLPNGEKFVSKLIYDEVGYAEILVLDAENYQLLEQTMESRFKTSSLVTENGDYIDVLVDDSESLAEEKLKEWSDADKTVYGYKEFAELYHDYGIEGYIINIDGFIPELPDLQLGFEEEVISEIPNVPEESKLTIDSFREVTPTNFTSAAQMFNKYEADEDYKLASQKATNKYNAERTVKVDAATSMYLESSELLTAYEKDEIIFIKEGTVIGRTMTDMELLEKVRKDETTGELATGTFEENRPTYIGEFDPEEKDKIIGNYLRIIMTDTKQEIVENVEDYMKLDEIEEEIEWELFYWLPFECGAVDKDGCGPESYSSCSLGEVGCGLAQWTVLWEGPPGDPRRNNNDGTKTPDEFPTHNMNNITDDFIPRCIKENPTLCAPLSAFASWTPEDFWRDYYGNDWSNYSSKGDKGEKQFGKALSEICDNNREEFLKVQMKVAKEEYLEPLLEEYEWLAARPLCVQGIIMHYRLWTGNVEKLELDECEDMTNEEIMLRVRWAIANTGSTMGPPSGKEDEGRAWNEPEIGLAILAGKLDIEEVEQWVREKDYDLLERNGIDYK